MALQTQTAPLPIPARAAVADLIRRARAAQSIYAQFSQAQLDEVAVAAGWAIMEPTHNRALAELAVKDTGLGNAPDKIVKNHRKTLGLLRDLQGAKTTGIIAEYPETGITEIARPVGVVAAVVPSTNPGATPANNIINALKCGNAVILSPSPKGPCCSPAPRPALKGRPPLRERPHEDRHRSARCRARSSRTPRAERGSPGS